MTEPVPNLRDAPVWIDEAEVDPAWPLPNAPRPAPVAEPDTPLGQQRGSAPNRRLPPGVGYLVGAFMAVLIVAGLWAAGGFRDRGDLIRVVATGQLIATGPYEFRFSEVTAQQKTDYETKKPYWEMVVIGQARTTGDVSISPDYIESESGMFASKDPISGEIELPSSDRIGPSGADARTDFVPGLLFTRYAVSFDYKAAGYRPGPTLLFAVADIVYGPHFLTDDQEEWHDGTYSRRYELPVRVLPPNLD